MILGDAKDGGPAKVSVFENNLSEIGHLDAT
jgi:hypothetical protein